MLTADDIFTFSFIYFSVSTNRRVSRQHGFLGKYCEWILKRPIAGAKCCAAVTHICCIVAVEKWRNFWRTHRLKWEMNLAKYRSTPFRLYNWMLLAPNGSRMLARECVQGALSTFANRVEPWHFIIWFCSRFPWHSRPHKVELIAVTSHSILPISQC